MIAPKEKLKSYDLLLIKRTFTETSEMITFKDITAGIHFNVYIVCQEEGII